MSDSVYLGEICRLLIVVTLLMAAWGKTRTFADFKHNLVDAFKVPTVLSHFAASMVIGFEALLGIFIVLGSSTKLAMIAALILFSAFSVIILSALIGKLAISCNCFGRLPRNISHYDLLRNLVLIGACCYYLLVPSNPVILAMSEQLILWGIAFIVFQLMTNLFEINLLLMFKE